MQVREVQLENAPVPILVNTLGSVREVIPVHPLEEEEEEGYPMEVSEAALIELRPPSFDPGIGVFLA